MNIGNQSAFPIPSDFLPQGVCDVRGWTGMTYRQWLVGMAMQGFLANERYFRDVSKAGLAHWAIEMADFVCAELEKKP